MEIVAEEKAGIAFEIGEILPGVIQRRQKLLSITFVPRSAKLDHGLLVIIEKEPVLWTIEAQLVKGGPHLGRKRKIGGSLTVVDDNPGLIDKLFLTKALKKRAYVTVSEDARAVRGHKLRDANKAMTDDVVQQTSRKLADPVFLVAEKRFGVRPLERIAVKALQMNGRTAKISGINQCTAFERSVSKLGVVSNGDF